jgi:hypothetical protein
MSPSLRAKTWEPGAQYSSARKVDCPSCGKESGFILLLLFWPLMDWIMLTCFGGVDLFYSISSNANFIQKHPQTHLEIMFHHMSGHPLVQTSLHIKLTITICELQGTQLP